MYLYTGSIPCLECGQSYWIQVQTIAGKSKHYSRGLFAEMYPDNLDKKTSLKGIIEMLGVPIGFFRKMTSFNFWSIVMLACLPWILTFWRLYSMHCRNLRNIIFRCSTPIKCLCHSEKVQGNVIRIRDESDMNCCTVIDEKRTVNKYLALLGKLLNLQPAISYTENDGLAFRKDMK